MLDSLMTRNDKIGCGNDSYGVIPVKTTITNTMSSPRRRGSREYNPSRFPPPRE
ncbi:MAG: hypothetical protein SFT93_05295 [Rickettsiaceae bacterium]|nr:hypothetical protein [Rickettsiaceae bacterium]